MKKLTLTEACLMEASGELGGKAREKLHDHVNRFPRALLEYGGHTKDEWLLNGGTYHTNTIHEGGGELLVHDAPRLL